MVKTYMAFYREEYGMATLVKLEKHNSPFDLDKGLPRWANLAKGEKDPRTGKLCSECENFNGGGMHWGSPSCKSYGLGAKGGSRAHCTCDACF